MRDAFGGVFMTNLFLVFIFIYVSFTAVSLNYAKAYRLKNQIIDFIEQKEIKNLDDYFGFVGKDKSELENIIKNASYHKECSTTNEITINGKSGYCYKGIIILKDREEKIADTTSKNVYYQVLTYADWNLGALNKILAIGGQNASSAQVVSGTWEIQGEAKVVVK